MKPARYEGMAGIFVNLKIYDWRNSIGQGLFYKQRKAVDRLPGLAYDIDSCVLAACEAQNNSTFPAAIPPHSTLTGAVKQSGKDLRSEGEKF